MHPSARWLFPLILVLVIAAGGYYLWQLRQHREPEAPAPSVAPSPPAPAPPSAAETVQHPIEEAGPENKAAPLPALGESDAALHDALVAIFSKSALAQYFIFDGFVRRVVATVDALPRKSVPLRVLPFKPVPGRFLTSGQGDGLQVSRENAARYTPYVRVAEAVDTRRLVEVYVRFYPLFQQAYVELGYPNGYFNDRLIVAIDNLLAAPEVPDNVRLTQPKVLYAYADPELEALSAGQKMMLRMGGENEARVKAKLRDIRRALTAKGAQPSP
jgi:hypothetical protein